MNSGARSRNPIRGLRSKKKRKTIYPTATELKLFEFLWRWKLATSPVVYEKFYAWRSRRNSYNRLLRMERQGYLKYLQDQSCVYRAWSLGKRGYQAIKHRLPVLESDGYKTENVGHDYLVTTAHQGTWVLSPPDDVYISTEQELRRVDPDHLPRWVPNPKDHRPDGYWAAQNGSDWSLVALEVEISRKLAINYDLVARFYAQYPAVKRVLWLVDKESMKKWLIRKLCKTGADGSVHNFVTLEPYLTSGWNTTIEAGPDAGMSISEMLHTRLRIQGLKKDYKGATSLHPQYLLDSRKCSFMLGSYENHEKLKTGVSSSGVRVVNRGNV